MITSNGLDIKFGIEQNDEIVTWVSSSWYSIVPGRIFDNRGVVLTNFVILQSEFGALCTRREFVCH